jgi:cell division protein FtsL
VGADAAAAAAAATASAFAFAAHPAEPDQSETTKPAPHLRVVEAPKLSAAGRRRRARLMLLGGVGLIVAIAFGLVYLHVAMAQRQFTLDQLNTRVQTQQADYQKLRLKVAQLDSPQNVISVAVGKLGMHQPTSVSYLAPTTTVGQPAAPATTAKSSSASANANTAPAGDADWPQIKSQLAGIP